MLAAGATWSQVRGYSVAAGLSPLTRGNRFGPQSEPAPLGPIPAHAGQPGWRPRGRRPRGAYPRSRGATGSACGGSAWSGGLSPLTRGNLLRHDRRCAGVGPIPAHAGQPTCPRARSRHCWAYPRSRGATTRAYLCFSRALGLSPLTRGNLSRSREHDGAKGPIPAHAGQPASDPGGEHPGAGLSPLTRGNPPMVRGCSSSPRGLSPLTRGNLFLHQARHRALGPIPAHAGQPR